MFLSFLTGYFLYALDFLLGVGVVSIFLYFVFMFVFIIWHVHSIMTCVLFIMSVKVISTFVCVTLFGHLICEVFFCWYQYCLYMSCSSCHYSTCFNSYSVWSAIVVTIIMVYDCPMHPGPAVFSLDNSYWPYRWKCMLFESIIVHNHLILSYLQYVCDLYHNHEIWMTHRFSLGFFLLACGIVSLQDLEILSQC